jgi:ribosomal protein L37AE/L43A
MSSLRLGKEYQSQKPMCCDCGRAAVAMIDARCWDCVCAYHRKLNAEHASTLKSLRGREWR